MALIITNCSLLSAILFFLQFFCLLQSSHSQKTSQVHSAPYPTFKPNEFTRNVVLEISEKVISADCTNRPSVVINGTFPGPELRFKAGDKVKIRVYNRLKTHNVTFHGHGISQYGSPWSDGTEKISQFAIAVGDYYDYIFMLDTNSPGTYMYHAHVGFDLMTCHGALLVEDVVAPPFKYDEELVLLFADYYHNVEKQIETGLQSAPFQWLGEPQSLVVNGNALGNCNRTSLFGCSNNCHHHRISVKPGRTYRVRVIGITVLTYLYFGIEGHDDLSIIEADASYVRPASAKHMQLHSGQRYSFLLKTKSRAELQRHLRETFGGGLKHDGVRSVTKRLLYFTMKMIHQQLLLTIATLLPPILIFLEHPFPILKRSANSFLCPTKAIRGRRTILSHSTHMKSLPRPPK